MTLLPRCGQALLAMLMLAATSRALAQQPTNPIHPTFKPLTREGAPARRLEDVATDVTCGACHDAAYIRSHDVHSTRSSATCIDCHVDSNVSWAELDEHGFLPRDALRIGSPQASQCARCHGVVASSTVAIPERPDLPEPQERTASLTLGEGAIVSGETIASSFLNVADKANEPGPWDVHAAKLVDCVGCHHAANDPARVDVKKEKLTYVYADPRRASTAEFLHRPDHRLASLDCRACHDTSQNHAFLPYRARHLQQLACQACHIQAPLGPAAEMIDATSLDAQGEPLVRYRNRSNDEQAAANAVSLEPLRPPLIQRRLRDGGTRLTPVNIISRFHWQSASGPVPLATLRQALFKGTRYEASILVVFDANRDGQLSLQELRLDSEPKAEAVRRRLQALGVVAPAIRAQLEIHPLVHGVPSRARALKDCAECHSASSRLTGKRLLASYLPGGVVPLWPNGGGFTLTGNLKREGDRLFLSAAESPRSTGLHVLGFSRGSWSNAVGFSLFLGVAVGLAAHAFVRVLTRKRRTASEHPLRGEREYVFGRYERLWHWTMAGAGVALIATGVIIHGGAPSGVELASAVTVHNVAALVLIANAFLGFFYHSATAAIRNFIPESNGLVRRVLEHLEYQTRGIFYGNPHPPNAPGSKLNPLQQLTYLALLNVLFPLQIGTGVMMWALGEWPSLASTIGALTLVAPIHNFGSWLFLTFFVLHVYLVTTGRTPDEHLRSMLSGYRTVEPAADGAPADPPASKQP